MTREKRRVPDIVVRDGKPVAVIIPIRDYRDMLKRLGDTDSLDVLRHGLREARGASLEDGLWESPLPKADVLPKLLAICREFTNKAPEGVVFQEPFLPYIPDGWNGVLVLAVAQNLSTAGKVIVREYASYLEHLDTEHRYWRLYPEKNQASPLVRAQPDALGIGPWDNGRGKKMLQGSLPDTAKLAVSNACPWSRRNARGGDAPPSKACKELAAEFWIEMLYVLQPREIVTFGAISAEIMALAGQWHRCKRFPFPSRQNENLGRRA